MSDSYKRIESTLYLSLSLLFTLSLISPPINRIADYFFTSPSVKAPATPKVSSTPPLTSIPVSTNLKGEELYRYLHKGQSIQTPSKGEIIGNHRITSVFGRRIHPITGASQFHNGVDIAVPLNTPLYNPSKLEGVVTSDSNRIGGLMCFLSLTSKGQEVGIVIGYAHMNSCNIGRVKGHQLIGKSGNTGASTGPHLHLTTRVNDKVIAPSRYWAERVTKRIN